MSAVAQQLGIVGVGLIGGSVALAARAARACAGVIGYDRDPAAVAKARELGIIDRAAESLATLAANADLIVVAVPVSAMAETFAALAPAVAPRAVLTDVGSVKSAVIAGARGALGARYPRFVPGHPLAGTEHHGPAAAFAELFRGQRVLLTPESGTDADAVAAVQSLWQAAGAKVELIAADQHDRILAATSHLPHALSYLLVDCLLQHGLGTDMFRLSGGGFRDFTRIAGSNPALWQDIFASNRAAVGLWLQRYADALRAFATAFAAGDDGYVRAVLDRAASARRGYSQTPK
jgi:prephenate dehydrogenase